MLGLCKIILLSTLSLLFSPSSLYAAPVGESKVVRGTPWEVDASQVLVHLEGQYECSGTLIAPAWVLTAAHCEASATTAKVGQLIRGDETPSSAVLDFVPHPLWDGWAYDLALLRIAPPIFDLHLPSLADELPSLGPYSGRYGGWGRIAGDESQITDVPRWGLVEEIVECGEDFAGKGPLFCWEADLTSSCGGDSGSAVWSEYGDIIGVHVMGYRGCPLGYAGATTDITHPKNRDWVLGVISGEIRANFEWPPPEVSGVSIAGGWAFSGDPATEIYPLVDLWVDGEFAIDMPCCSSRGDVSSVFPSAPLLAGFGGAYNWSGLLSVGRHSLQIRVRDFAGNELRLGKEVEVFPTAPRH